MILVDDPVQTGTQAFVDVIHCTSAATKTQRTLMGNTIRIEHFLVFRQRGITLVTGATQGQPQNVLDQRTLNRKIVSCVGTKLVFLLEAATDCCRTCPAVSNLAGNDIDYTTQSIRTVQGRGRAADHFDTLDHVEGRNMVELVATKGIRVDVTVVVLATTIDQDQGVIRTHTAHADGALTGFVRGLTNVYAFQLTH